MRGVINGFRRSFALTWEWLVGHESRMSICLRLALLFTVIFAQAALSAEDWVTWDRSTDRVVSNSDKAASYPRARRLSNGDILL